MYPVLYETGFANQPTATDRNDGLKLKNLYITAAVRCAPPDNKPLPTELLACSAFLDRELAGLERVTVVVALGKIGFDAYRVTPAMLGRLIRMVESGAIGGKSAKEVFDEMSASGDSPEAIVERKGLSQVSDPAVIRDAALRVIERNAAQVEQYRGGKTQVFGFLVGQLMKETRGKAKAELANEILRELLQ